MGTTLEKPSIREGRLSETERDQLIIQYLPWVKFIALRMAAKLPTHVQAEDLISAGIIGLIDALDKFNPAREVQFKTYAQIRIQGAMKDELRALDWASRSMRQKVKRLEHAYAILEQELGRPPSSEEVAGSLGIEMDTFEEMLDDVKGTSLVSLEDLGQGPASEDKSSLLEALLTRQDQDPLEMLNLQNLKKALTLTIAELPEKERLVLSLYYFEELTMKEVGKVLNLTESRISQLHTQAVLRLRGKLKAYLAS
ncbi:MAG TPA: FliA/WhiG family RNA polymerase sigma factor [Candidatus Tectomicrobia bacterium]|nr:FliA/WhiG family RNA polymerase sigma factor [Candidatus Tectomicrobia bacterium]